MTAPGWVLLHPDMTAAHLGYLPDFLDSDDPDDARKQLDKNYPHGGWQPMGNGRIKMQRNFTLTYPGDPPMRPIALTKLRDELILLYESDIVAVVQKGGSFEVARMD
jgi:hypothetical protein